MLLVNAHHLGGVAVEATTCGGSAEVQRGVHAIRKLGCLRGGTERLIVGVWLLQQGLVPLSVFKLGRIRC